jgi:hypothetical protein
MDEQESRNPDLPLEATTRNADIKDSDTGVDDEDGLIHLTLYESRRSGGGIEAEADLPTGTDAVASFTGAAVPRQDHEFVCCSCFLVKDRNQLADVSSELCRDCA